MSDYLMRAFRAQLTTSMDSLLRKAVFEIMMMFENSLRDHQMELAQRGEEVAHLKIKLQRAEVKLSEVERGGDRGTETKKDVVNPPEQTADVPEIDFELPDDWCAPLGFDNATKQEEIVCPSVRLRPLSIPLWPIPIIKEEVVNNDIGSHQQTKSPRRSRRSSSLNKLHTYKDKRSRRPPLRSDTKKLLQDIKQEFTDQTDTDTLPRRRGRPLKVKGRRKKIKSKREGRKMAATEPRENETATNGKRYSCKFCKKQFDTLFGRSVHLRSHKKCKGCKKEFPFPSVLKCHKPFCKKLRKMLAKRAQSTNLPKSESCYEETPPAPSKKQVIVKEHSTRSPGNHIKSSIQDGPTNKHSCVQCNKVFHCGGRLKDHMRIHTGERPFLCSMCPKKFRTNQSLKMHFFRMHKDETNSSDTNQNSMWTKPLEPEDTGDNLMSPKQDKRQGINRNNVQRNCKQDSSIWRTMGTLGSEGFICSLCQKVSKNKYMLIEHFRTHTGEKPLKCNRCPAVFRSRGQLSMHKKKCYDPTNVTQCD